MVRSQPNILREDEVIDKLKKLNLMQGEVIQENTEQKCFHGKPLFTKLYSLEDMAMSQTSHPKPGD